MGIYCSKSSEKKVISTDGISNLMPDLTGEKQWKSEGDTKCYKDDELFNYMDGGAELYYSYGFKKACVQDYYKGDYLYTLEVYEMEDSPKAFGIYSINREGEHPVLGQEAAYQEGFLNIWKGHYYIRIFTPQKGPNTKNEILFLGEKTIARIKDEGKMPALSNFVPAKAVKDTVMFFWQMGPLNNIFFISHEDLLNLSDETEGVTFLMPAGKENVRIVLINYPDSSRAGDSMDKLVRGYFSPPPDYQIKDEYRGKKGEKKVVVKTQGSFVLLAAGVDEAAADNAILESVKNIEAK